VRLVKLNLQYVKSAACSGSQDAVWRTSEAGWWRAVSARGAGNSTRSRESPVAGNLAREKQSERSRRRQRRRPLRDRAQKIVARDAHQRALRLLRHLDPRPSIGRSKSSAGGGRAGGRPSGAASGNVAPRPLPPVSPPLFSSFLVSTPRERTCFDGLVEEDPREEAAKGGWRCGEAPSHSLPERDHRAVGGAPNAVPVVRRLYSGGRIQLKTISARVSLYRCNRPQS
jgi:hypothetical protein